MANKEMLLIASKTKEALKGGGTYNVSGDALEALNSYVHWLIDQAQKRCEANGRKTIRNHDILTECK
ncbi:MAG: hypothetical protein MJA29_03555 [Candidatus Omnitrophica bacterium]|nr:hypothetical protein [Candidatus Omnitrophota bacterium]